MRDIQNSNGVNTLQPKTKIGNMTGTTTLTRLDYRSYRDFLESYQDNKNVKDDQESVSSTDSGISSYKLSENRSNHTSTSSLNSDTTGNGVKTVQKLEQPTAFGNRTGSFRNYLESYNCKKFNSVKPTLPPSKPHVVKSEIKIQLNGSGEDHVDDSGYISPCTEYDAPNYPPPPPITQETTEVQEPCLAPPPPPLPPAAPRTTKKWTTVRPEKNYQNHPSTAEANEAAANLAKILTQHLLPRRQALEESEKALPVVPKPECVNPKVSYDRSVDYNTTTVVPVTDTSAEIKKSDPNVRKLVYNTYRGFLGAYNCKANDMIATLPRSMVKEDQGITKQLESIALQGGLEKLNGRINPNVEQE